MLLWSKNMVIILTKWIADDPRYSKHFFLFSLLGMNVAKLSHVSLGVVWTSFESSIEILALYLCDQKVVPPMKKKSPHSIWTIYIFDIVKVLGNAYTIYSPFCKLLPHTLRRDFYCSGSFQIVINQS